MPGRTGWGLGLWTLAATLSVVASMPKDDHFRSVLRPAHWGGLELPGKPASTKQRRVHGAVHPHVIQMPRSAPGQKTFRVYLEMSPTQAKSIYACRSPPRPGIHILPRTRNTPTGLGAVGWSDKGVRSGQCLATTTPPWSSLWMSRTSNCIK
eukprot:COSAG01_NODE_469_length_16584_cov_10.725265_1_plen_152_part_00